MGLKLENVSKKFVGKQAVDNISFEVDKPSVFGLLGTNGAGMDYLVQMEQERLLQSECFLELSKKIQVK